MIRRIKALALGFFLLAATAHAAPTPLEADIRWEYSEIPGPMRLYQPTAKKALTLWEMGNGKALTDLPVGEEITDSKIRVFPGGKKQFVLVMKNDTDKPVYFFAAPHVMSPPAHSLGFKFKCLCVNHVFSIPPGEYWYRVVELRLENSTVAGPVTITHNLIKVDEAAMNGMNAKKPEMDHEM